MPRPTGAKRSSTGAIWSIAVTAIRGRLDESGISARWPQVACAAVRTAIVSDLHLGGLTGEDLLGDRGIRNVLFEEVRGADRLVLLGDTIELRDLPVSEALERSRPFFAELGEALAGREVVIVAGNHDHRLAEPLVDRRELAAKSLGLAN